MNVGNRISEAITFYGRNPPMLCNELSFDCFNGSSGSRHCCRLRPNVNNKWRRLPLVKACRRLRVSECDVNSQIWCKSGEKHTFGNLCPLEHPKSEFIPRTACGASEPLGTVTFADFKWIRDGITRPNVMNFKWAHMPSSHNYDFEEEFPARVALKAGDVFRGWIKHLRSLKILIYLTATKRALPPRGWLKANSRLSKVKVET